MWDPQEYLNHAELRARPFRDLVARIGAERPRRVVDAGCGPGTLTGELARRWPGAIVEAFDSSPEMVSSARERGVAARLCDVTEWRPEPDTDVVVSNAVLQWVPEHDAVLRRWVRELPSGAWLAVQVPGNMDAPSHRAARAVAARDRWVRRLRDVRLRGTGAVSEPRDYANLFADLGCAVDVWETTYVQRLRGEHAVLDWLTGTALRPIVAALDDDEWQEFRRDLAPVLDEAYPPRSDGTTWFPFRRIFAVARTPS